MQRGIFKTNAKRLDTWPPPAGAALGQRVIGPPGRTTKALAKAASDQLSWPRYGPRRLLFRHGLCAYTYTYMYGLYAYTYTYMERPHRPYPHPRKSYKTKIATQRQVLLRRCSLRCDQQQTKTPAKCLSLKATNGIHTNHVHTNGPSGHNRTKRVSQSFRSGGGDPAGVSGATPATGEHPTGQRRPPYGSYEAQPSGWTTVASTPGPGWECIASNMRIYIQLSIYLSLLSLSG